MCHKDTITISLKNNIIYVYVYVKGMVTVCIASGAWLVAICELFPQINLYFPGTQTQLLLGFIMMVIASTIAFFLLIRGLFQIMPKLLMLIPLFAGLSSMMIGFTVKEYRAEGADLLKLEPL